MLAFLPNFTKGSGVIISIDRQTGSGGKELAQKLSQSLGFKFLDENELLEYASKIGYFEQMYSFYHETAVNSLMQAIVQNEGVNPNKEIIKEIYKSLANSGNFVILGRCANHFLRQNSNFFSIFLHADFEFKLQRLIKLGKLKETAEQYMENEDFNRISFHKFHTKEEWGNASFYDLCINSSSLGIDGSLELILQAMKIKFGKNFAQNSNS